MSASTLPGSEGSMMSVKAIPGSAVAGGRTRRLGRRRSILISSVLAALLAALGASSALALHGDSGGFVIGPWSCGPDEQVGLTFHVTGSLHYPAGVTLWYYDHFGDEYGYDWNLRAGYTEIGPYLLGVTSRNIVKFDWTTSGNGVIVSWTKDCM